MKTLLIVGVVAFVLLALPSAAPSVEVQKDAGQPVGKSLAEQALEVAKSFFGAVTAVAERTKGEPTSADVPRAEDAGGGAGDYQTLKEFYA